MSADTRRRFRDHRLDEIVSHERVRLSSAVLALLRLIFERERLRFLEIETTADRSRSLSLRAQVYLTRIFQ